MQQASLLLKHANLPNTLPGKNLGLRRAGCPAFTHSRFSTAATVNLITGKGSYGSN